MDRFELLRGVSELVERVKILEAEVRHSVPAEKFYNSALTVDMVARLHGVSPYVVRKYIKKGLIDTHQDSSESKLLVRGSVALMLDFAKLKQQSKYETN